MSKWKDVQLRDVLQPKGYIRGPFGSALRRNELLSNGIPVYEQQHAIYGVRTFRFFISDDKYEEMRRFTTLPDDIIISCSGTLGKVSRIKANDPKGIISQALLLLRADTDKIRSRYLQYFLSSKEGFNAMVSRSSGSVQVNLARREIIEAIPFCMPDLQEQDRILSILASLDNKIGLLVHQNATIEALAQTFFRQWFVENPNEDWEERGSDGIATFLNGLPLQKYPYKSGEPMNVIKIKELNSGYSENSDICSSDVPEKYIVHLGDVIFSWSGSLVVDIWKYDEGALNQHLFKVTSEKYPKWFYYYWIKRHLPEFKIIAESKATTMGHIQRGHLTAAKVLVPSDEELKVMGETMEPLIEKIESNNGQILTLQKLRDTLLPKLISGEVRVKQ